MKPNKKIFGLALLKIILIFFATPTSSQWNLNYSVGTSTGKYVFSYNQTPDQLVEIISPTDAAMALNYLWESSLTPVFSNPSLIGSSSAYTFTQSLTQTTYFRRKVTDPTNSSNYIYSNIIEIQVASVNWENLNYIREHDVIITGINADWKSVDQLTIGQKLQTTTYLDGLGRPIEKVSRETATPANGNTLWGDIVQFSKYDGYGMETKQYLPYTIQYSTTTNTESGKYKNDPVTAQAQYYSATYNETFPFSQLTYQTNPLNRIGNVKAAGTLWAAGAGKSVAHDLNDLTDNVQKFTIGYTSGDIPVNQGSYPLNTLFKNIHTDDNGNDVIEYINYQGQVILKKTEMELAPSSAHNGWICTYYIYDDFGLLRYVLQPEAVKYLDANGWSFAGTNGQKVLDELCFRYEYDVKGRTVLKKAPGAKELRMLYDSRDRVVFMQDGNQSTKYTGGYSEWTVNLYDELDRATMTALYKTNKTISQLQADIDAALTVSTVTVSNSGEPINDLVVDTRVSSVARYAARNSISLVTDAGGNFASGTNDEFIAEIDATAATPVINTTVAVFKNPVSSSDLNNASVTTILKYNYYDNYNFTGAKPFDNSFDNSTAYSNSDPNVIPIAVSNRTLSYPTGNMVRVLGTNTFLLNTQYYDNKGRLIQTIEDNIKQGKDVTTMQYHFDGRLLSTHTKHSTVYSGYTNYSILTKNIFDKTGRITSLQKKYGANNFKTIASYDYDDIGRLKTKHLDPGYTGSGKNELESLTYSYNIHNNITGINKDYALKTTGIYSKWDNFFGLYLGYDNKDNVFNGAQLDGHVTGILWCTQGDDAQRKYDYSYDKAGRLTNATFKEKQKPGDTWDNSKIDFSVTGTNGAINYDLNGNLLSILQKGVIAGTATPVEVDKLAYSYALYSNKLTAVTDNTAQTSTNGKSGDFKDGTNSTGDDYAYDNNGNMVLDNNKAVSSISYNFLDKPELITITGKGVIKIVYDAEGNKLQKIFTPQSGPTVITTYINQFVYKENELQYINFEEGRIRVITPISTNNGYDGLAIDGNMTLLNGMKGAFDYFIRDYQENIRMILTEEIHSGSNICTMESSRSGSEEPMFGQTAPNNEVSKTRFNKPQEWANNTSNSVSRLGSLAAGKTGPNALLKVMAGDVISTSASYYYKNPVANGTGNNLTTNVLTSLVGAISSSTSAGELVKGATGNITTQLSGMSVFSDKTAPDANNATGTNPKAYLTILFFDERFNYVSEGSTSLRVLQAGNGAGPLVIPNVKVPKNGFAYVYVSNESSEMVYFDDLNVALTRGRIIEEDHYYAYGLKIAAISSVKLGDLNEGMLNNKNLYNDKELFDDADLDWYDYGFRNYDAQIGRFTQLDPLTWDYPELTNYQYASDEPIANIDMDGLEKCPVNVAGPVSKAASVNVFQSFFTGLVSNGVNLYNNLKQAPKNFQNNLSIQQYNWTKRLNDVKGYFTEKWGIFNWNIQKKAVQENKQTWRVATETLLNIDLNEPLTWIIGHEEGVIENVEKEVLGNEIRTNAIDQAGNWTREKLLNELKEIAEREKNTWIDVAGNYKWPHNDGFKGMPKNTILKKGGTFDRYGDDLGNFASPVGTPFEKRSLPQNYKTEKTLIKYQVIKPFNVLEGETAPWFNQPGGGTQYKLSKSIKDLIKEGYIKQI